MKPRTPQCACFLSIRSTLLGAHQSIATSYQVIPYAIQQLQQAGYRLVSVAECLGKPAYLNVGPPQNRDVRTPAISQPSRLNVRYLSLAGCVKIRVMEVPQHSCATDACIVDSYREISLMARYRDTLFKLEMRTTEPRYEAVYDITV